MKTLILAAVLVQAAPAKAPDAAEVQRFLAFAVFEGLWEDGADPALAGQIAREPYEEWFVPKCTICHGVRQGLLSYASAPDETMGGSRGQAFPKELAAGLRSSKREERLKALGTLVDRYVARRLDRLKLSDDERASFRDALARYKKLAMAILLKAKFPGGCPSCTGASPGP
jgi:mono/diheme cytochrome c family protein